MDPAEYAKAVRIIRRNMPYCTRTLYEPEDFVQQAALEVLAGADPKLFIRIAMHRMTDAYRCLKRRRWIPCESLDVFAAIQATAQENFDAVELREQLIASVDNDEERAIIVLALEGCPRAEIAVKVGCMPYVVQRFLAGLKP